MAQHTIEVDTTIAKPGAPADVILKVDGDEVGRDTVKRTVPAAFSASETFDVGVDLGSVVSLDYFDRRPFRFNGKSKRLKSTSNKLNADMLQMSRKVSKDEVSIAPDSSRLSIEN